MIFNKLSIKDFDRIHLSQLYYERMTFVTESGHVYYKNPDNEIVIRPSDHRLMCFKRDIFVGSIRKLSYKVDMDYVGLLLHFSSDLLNMSVDQYFRCDETLPMLSELSGILQSGIDEIIKKLS